MCVCVYVGVEKKEAGRMPTYETGKEGPAFLLIDA